MSKEFPNTGKEEGDVEEENYRKSLVGNSRRDEAGPFGDILHNNQDFVVFVLDSIMNSETNSESSIDDELYNVDNDYLHKLNSIRRKLNMVELVNDQDDTPRPSVVITELPASPRNDKKGYRKHSRTRYGTKKNTSTHRTRDIPDVHRPSKTKYKSKEYTRNYDTGSTSAGPSRDRRKKITRIESSSRDYQDDSGSEGFSFAEEKSRLMKNLETITQRMNQKITINVDQFDYNPPKKKICLRDKSPLISRTTSIKESKFPLISRTTSIKESKSPLISRTTSIKESKKISDLRPRNVEKVAVHRETSTQSNQSKICGEIPKGIIRNIDTQVNEENITEGVPVEKHIYPSKQSSKKKITLDSAPIPSCSTREPVIFKPLSADLNYEVEPLYINKFETDSNTDEPKSKLNVSTPSMARGNYLLNVQPKFATNKNYRKKPEEKRSSQKQSIQKKTIIKYALQDCSTSNTDLRGTTEVPEQNRSSKKFPGISDLTKYVGYFSQTVAVNPESNPPDKPYLSAPDVQFLKNGRNFISKSAPKLLMKTTLHTEDYRFMPLRNSPVQFRQQADQCTEYDCFPKSTADGSARSYPGSDSEVDSSCFRCICPGGCR